VLFELARDEVTPGDLKFLRGGIAGQTDHFKTIAQRGLNRIEPVGRGDEEDVGQIERQVEIMIGKSVVLLRVEHLQQSRGGIAAEVRTDFVDLIEQDNRIAGLHAPERLDNATGHGAHIGAAMAADLGLVAKPAEGETGELASQRVRQALAERSFADPGGADQAKDGPLRSFLV
jgi:hypothetical protein